MVLPLGPRPHNTLAKVKVKAAIMTASSRSLTRSLARLHAHTFILVQRDAESERNANWPDGE